MQAMLDDFHLALDEFVQSASSKQIELALLDGGQLDVRSYANLKGFRSTEKNALGPVKLIQVKF